MRCTSCTNGLVHITRSSPADPDVAPCSRCTGGFIAPDLEVFVPGRPRPQGSKSQGLNGQMYEASKYIDGWRADVQAACMRHGVYLHGPLALGAEFLFKRPAKGHTLQCKTCRGEGWLGTNSCPGGCAGSGQVVREDAPVYFTGAPDLDKLHRAIQDSLEAAGVCRNDSQFVRYHDPVKRYANPGEQPGARIRVWRL